MAIERERKFLVDDTKLPASIPEWITQEVTGDPSYSNQALAWKYGRREFYKYT